MIGGLLGDCTGLWRRTLLIEADGSQDASTDVVWLQGISAYVDSRGFAGVLHQRGDVFEWQRDIDTQPPEPVPDVGAMHWDGDTLIEKGVYADYVEHWVRDPGPAAPCWAIALTSQAGGGLLMCVGDTFGWASGDGVVVGRVGAPEWDALGPQRLNGDLRANGVRWSVERSEGNVEL